MIGKIKKVSIKLPFKFLDGTTLVTCHVFVYNSSSNSKAEGLTIKVYLALKIDYSNGTKQHHQPVQSN